MELEKKMVCPCTCGKMLHSEEAIYCGRCGKKLIKEESKLRSELITAWNLWVRENQSHET